MLNSPQSALLLNTSLEAGLTPLPPAPPQVPFGTLFFLLILIYASSSVMQIWSSQCIIIIIIILHSTDEAFIFWFLFLFSSL